jgi:hypothetical protein
MDIKQELSKLQELINQPCNYNVIAWPTVTGQNAETVYKGDVVLHQARKFLNNLVAELEKEVTPNA